MGQISGRGCVNLWDDYGGCRRRRSAVRRVAATATATAATATATAATATASTSPPTASKRRALSGAAAAST